MRFVLLTLGLFLLTHHTIASNLITLHSSQALHTKLHSNKGLLLLILHDRNCVHCRHFLPKLQKQAISDDSIAYAAMDMHGHYNLMDEYIKHGLEYYPFMIMYKGDRIVAKMTVGDNDGKAIGWIKDTKKRNGREGEGSVGVGFAKMKAEILGYE